MTLKTATFQLNATLGDLQGNARKIIAAARQAHAEQVDLLLTPELGICGTPALDLLLQPGFVAACAASVRQIAAETADLHGLTLVVGHPVPGASDAGSAARVCSALSVLREGHVVASGTRQQVSPDEARWFVPGGRQAVFDVAGVRCALLAAQDASSAERLSAALQDGVQLLLLADAAPYYQGSVAERQHRLAAAARRSARPLFYVNALGGQDGVVHDGAALALSAGGDVVADAPRWRGQPLVLALATDTWRWQPGGTAMAAAEDDADLWHALVLGLRDYLGKNGFSSATLGLSGGLDSALVLALAVDALGPEQVRVLLMPSRYTADISMADAHDMARRVGVRCDDIDIWPLFEGYKAALAPLFGDRPEDTTEENLQARIRGDLLMALSNKFGHVVLVTSNKSEAAVGYSTLYGDMCGGYAPISDLYKTAVFRLARWRNAHDPLGRGAQPIPERIITRPPSAELRANQRDDDSLPPYEVLDALIAGHLETGASAAELAARGFDADTVRRVLRLIRTSEYKRAQAAPSTRVSRHGFVSGRRHPLGHKFGA